MSKSKSKPSVTAKPKDNPLSEGHHMGKQCGYNVKDGIVYVAPMHKDSMNQLVADMRALGEYHASVERSLHDAYRSMSRRRQDFWKRLQEDLGFSIKDWDFDCYSGSISKTDLASDDNKVDLPDDEETNDGPQAPQAPAKS